MNWHQRALAALCMILLPLLWTPSTTHQVIAQTGQTLAEDWRQSTDADFTSGTLENVQIVDSGDGALALASQAGEHASQGLYTSSVRRAGLQFNAVGVQWQAQAPPGTSVLVYLRVSADGSAWSPWQQVTDPEQDGPFFFAPLPIVVEPATFLQYRLELQTDEPPGTPQVDEVTVTCIDSRLGPSLGEVERLQLAAEPEPGGVPRPPIISRAQWGANEAYRFDGSGNEVWPLEYRTPRKVVIHHSVTLNNDPNPPQTVRAIYYYHAITLGWGDVGYNYLVDWRGNIYQGRYGGPEVVAGHAYSYNHGSVGICGMGSYGNTADSVQPSPELLQGLVDVTAWSCSRVLLHPLESSFFVDKTTQNIAGHRDYNATACPGDYLYAKLPSLRSSVWAEIVDHTAVHWANYLSYEAPSVLKVGQSATASLLIENAGTLTWLAEGTDRVEFGYRWRDAQGSVTQGQARTPLPHDVAYGHEVELDEVAIVAPDQPGRYTLKLDLIHRGVGWFSVQGCPAVNTTVIVYDPESWQETYLPLLNARQAPPSVNLEARALWVPRWSYTTASDVRTIVDEAADANFNILLFQVRGQGDAYYDSRYEPWADRLTGTLGQDPGWDPLATAISAAHARGLQLHAYVNVYPVWLGTQAPPINTSPQHMYPLFNGLYGNQWVQWHENGTPMVLNSSYLTASPGHAAVADHIVSVCRDILQHYEVDGLHLDYVRYSSPYYSHDPVSEERFAAAQPIGWADWQRAQITDLVSRLHDQVEELRPEAALSVAAWPIYQDKWGWVTYGSVKYDGYDGHFQDSRGWLRSGDADFLAPMLYGTSVQDYLDRYEILINDFVGESYGRQIYAGIHAGYSSFSEIEERIEIARQAGAQGQAIFAYSLIEGNQYWDDFKEGPYAEPAQVPPMPWKG